MAKQKKMVYKDITKELAEDAMSRFAKAANNISAIEAEMNQKIQAIREQFTDRITTQEELKDEAVEVLEVFAYEQKESWGKRKSTELLHGIIGFRTGTPKVKFEKGFNGKSVTALLEEHYPEFVRKVTELDKEKIIAFREDEGFAALSKKAHVTVEQDETFYCESKAEVLQD